MKLSSENLKELMQSKTDEKLYDILQVHSQEYTQESFDAASEEFRRRHLDASKLTILGAGAEQTREQEGAHLSWPLRIVAFFVSTAIFFIPVLLAHRHFVEKGERQKARDWAKWAVYGFIFYCALGVLSRLLTSFSN